MDHFHHRFIKEPCIYYDTQGRSRENLLGVWNFFSLWQEGDEFYDVIHVASKQKTFIFHTIPEVLYGCCEELVKSQTIKQFTIFTSWISINGVRFRNHFACNSRKNFEKVRRLTWKSSRSFLLALSVIWEVVQGIIFHFKLQFKLENWLQYLM